MGEAASMKRPLHRHLVCFVALIAALTASCSSDSSSPADTEQGGSGGTSNTDMGDASDSGGASTGGSDGGESDSGVGGGGAGGGEGDLTFACDRMDTDGNGLRICTDYFYPALVVELASITPACPGPGDGVLLDACDTTDAVIGCLATDADGLPGVNVTNWFYAGTAEEIMNGVLCSEEGVEFVEP